MHGEQQPSPPKGPLCVSDGLTHLWTPWAWNTRGTWQIGRVQRPRVWTGLKYGHALGCTNNIAANCCIARHTQRHCDGELFPDTFLKPCEGSRFSRGMIHGAGVQNISPCSQPKLFCPLQSHIYCGILTIMPWNPKETYPSFTFNLKVV